MVRGCDNPGAHANHQKSKVDDTGAANPLAGRIDRIIAHGISQPARLLHDFVELGFNRDEHHRQVFDGILDYIAGASGGFFNYRFAQPFRTHRQHIGRWTRPRKPAPSGTDAARTVNGREFEFNLP